MKYFFDTSVLVAAFVDDHPHHSASLSAFAQADKKHASCGVHSLAEVYATLTRLPGRYRVSANEALLFLENIKERLTFIDLDSEEYWGAITRSAEAGIVGGTVYDALLLHCALKARVDVIFTWDVRHFQLLGGEVAKQVRTP
jgi:predicted nucleic acid-binding protein